MIKVGDRFTLAEEDVFGEISNIFYDERMEVVAVVVQMDNGQWATVDMRLVEARTLH